MVDLESFATRDFHSSGIEPELFEDRGVNVSDIVAIFDGMKANLVSRPMHDAPFESAPCHPDGEAEVMVVASVAILRSRRATELGGEDDERFVQHPATIQIFNECGDRLVDRQRQRRVVRFDAEVSVPGPGSAAPMLDLNESHASFDEPTGGQQLFGKVGEVRNVDAVQSLGFSRLLREVHDFRHRVLHPERQLTIGFMLKLKLNIPVIIFSAYSSYRNDALAMAADAYVVKSSDL